MVDSNDQLMNVVMTSILLLICISGMIGNAIVLIVGIVRRKYQKNVTNCYIMNLAITDFLFLLISVPFTVYLGISKVWVFGEFFCKTHIYLAHVLLQATCYTLAAMSVDRYLNTVHEVWYRPYRKAKYTRVVCLLIWTVSCVFMFPYDYVLHITDASKMNQTSLGNDCTVTDNDSFFSSCLFTFTFYYMLPLCIIGLCYSRIFIHVRRSRGPIVKRLSGQPRQSVVIRHRRMKRVLFGLTLAFALCWLPIHILELLSCAHILSDTLYLNHTQALNVVRFIAHSLSYFNSCLNPVLYALLNQSYFSRNSS